MTSFEDTRSGFHTALLALTQFIRVDRVMGTQLPAGRREFFGADEPGSGADGSAVAQRFLEWFSLERRVEGTGGPPIVSFLGAGCPGLEPELRPFAEALSESRVGVFAIRDNDPEALEVEDAITGDVFRVWMPASERRTGAGQTLVGRLLRVPQQPDTWLASDATEVVPGNALFDAYAAEAQRRRLESAGVTGEDSPELTQLEVESVLRANAEAPDETPADVERELAKLLAEAPSEVDLPSADELSYALSVAERPGGIIGPFLEQVAFDTALELERAQRLCLRLWNAHHRPDPATQGAPSPDAADTGDVPAAESATELPTTEPKEAAAEPAPAEPSLTLRPGELGKQVLAELEAGMERGDDLERLFDRLEAMVGREEIETNGEPPEELTWHTEDEGDLVALLTEYLWEHERAGKSIDRSEAERLQALVQKLQALGVRNIERLEQEQLASALVEAWARGQEAEVLQTVAALATWSEWLVSVQELELQTDAHALLALLHEERERIGALGGRLTISEQSTGPVHSWRVTEPSDDGWLLTSSGGQMQLARDLPLRPGDVVLGDGTASGFRSGCRIIPSCLAAALA